MASKKKKVSSVALQLYNNAKPLTREGFFEFITRDTDDYSSLSLTSEEVGEVKKHLQLFSTGSVSAIAQTCTGPACPWAERCILQQMNKAPVGKACLIEVNLLREWRMAFFDEYQVTGESFTEITIINELAEIELLLWRINMSLSKRANVELVQDNVVGVDHQGNPIFQKQVNVLLDAKEKILTRKSRLIKMMVGDRQERYKREAALKRRDEKDASQTFAEMRKRYDSLRRQLEGISRDAREAVAVDAEIVEEKPLSAPKGGPISPDDIIASEDGSSEPVSPGS